MSPKIKRQIFLVALVVCTLLAVLLSGCGITRYQRFMDYRDAKQAELRAMHDAICAAGADTAECRVPK